MARVVLLGTALAVLAVPASLSVSAPTETTGTPKSMTCAGNAYRQFDFWVGDWDVVDIERPTAVVAHGCYSPSDYERQSLQLRGYARRHFTRDEVERLAHQARQGSIDIVLTHDAPAGVRYSRHRGGEFVSEAAGLADLIARVQPRVCFFGHHHTRLHGEVAGVRCIGLNKVAHPGNLCAIEMMQRERCWSVLGEWPARQVA